MKKSLALYTLFAIIIFTTPLFALKFDTPNTGSKATLETIMPQTSQSIAINIPEPTSETVWTTISEPEESNPTSNIVIGREKFKILNTNSGKVEEVSVKDYVRGAVASEMPAKFHSEALKAQAVAAHTYALYSANMQKKYPQEELKGADLSANPDNREGYMTVQKAKDFYQNDFNIYWTKICQAVDSVLAYVMVYDNEPILAAYHAISSGITEYAGNVWQGNADYLVPVQSKGDELAPDYETIAKFGKEDAKQIFTKEYPQIELDDDMQNWLGFVTRSEGGYVTEIEIGTVKADGKDIRRIFGLRSSSFEITFENGEMVFNVTGHGHGVGLSQYGADYMARQGSSFDEILSHYFQGSLLRTVE